MIIYFAGHGMPEADRPEEAFLLLHDTDLQNLVGSALSMTQLPEFLEWRAGQAGRLVMFVDACHSGTIQFPGGSRGVKVAERVQLVSGSLDQMAAAREGWGAISAAASDQYAGELSAEDTRCTFGGTPYQGGLFTCHLLHGAGGKADSDGDGQVRLDELDAYLNVAVVEATGGAQRPALSGSLDPKMALFTTPAGPVEIPSVPARYLVDPDEGNIDIYLWTGVGLAGAALVTGGLFHLFAESAATDIERTNETNPASRTRAEAQAEIDDQQQLVTVSRLSYVTAAAVGLVTLGAFLIEVALQPEDVGDVYGDPPWLQIHAGPESVGASLEVRWP